MENSRYYTLGKAAEHLTAQGMEIPVTTLRGWFNDLHKLKIHTLPRNERKDRVLSENDLKIAEFIYNAKKEYGTQITMKTIGEQLRSKFDVAYLVDDEDEKFQVDLMDEDRLRDLVKALVTTELATAGTTLVEQATQKLQLMLPDPKDAEEQRRVEVRTEQLNLRLTEATIRSELKQEAIDLWNKNPVKTGFLIKKEDTARKMEFIDNYIDQHLVKRLQMKYDIPVSPNNIID